MCFVSNSNKDKVLVMSCQIHVKINEVDMGICHAGKKKDIPLTKVENGGAGCKSGSSGSVRYLAEDSSAGKVFPSYLSDKIRQQG